MTRIRSSLSRLQGVTPMDDEQLKGKATKLWHETGTIMIRPDWLKSELDKMLLTTVATMLYGEREG